MRVIIILIGILVSDVAKGQTAWTWTELDTMPFRISNNAVTQATINGDDYVFSFGGIDTTKIYSGITKRSFKYNVSTDTWSEIAPLPASLENIAAAASTVKNKIYIIGGYHVLSNGNEISSDEVIIYNPTTNSYETNGAPIPTAIDDQVQCVWRDSLIYVITGWSNTSNVPNVQIYNPATNLWLGGTDVTNNHDFKAFGASGAIVDDTIYYFGGAKSSGGFNAVNKLRKGIINQNNPTEITWTLEEDGPNNGYRSACLSHGNNVFWVGGSAVSYNYNGIAYNGSGGVPPLTQIMRYDTYYRDWYEGQGAPFSVMDLRGVAQISSTEWIICGGMDENQQVTNRTFLLTYDPITGSVSENNATKTYVYNRLLHTDFSYNQAVLFDLSGKKIEEVKETQIQHSESGVYILKLIGENQVKTIKVVLD